MEWDYIIIGSGFGGSVSALRLVEKGYKVLVLEKGRRLQAGDFPKTNWNLKRFFWLPQVGFRGLFKMTFLGHVTALSGVGVGGGSLVYANTLPVPKDPFFEAPSWAHLADWKTELAAPYQLVLRMLGATRNPALTYPDEVLKAVGREIGRETTFEHTNVAVYFGKSGETVRDPFFNGEGPDRTGCTLCGGCMLGCNHGAKNTLDRNYLYLAEKLGLKIEADTEVTWVKPVDGGYEVEARQGTWALPALNRKQTYLAKNVIFAGGVLGTVPLLLKLKEAAAGLPALSDRVGDFVRTNSEVLVGVVTQRRDQDLSKGIAIGSILHTDEHSHLEPVRYSAGAGFFRTLMLPMAPGDTLFQRFANALGLVLRHPIRTLRTYFVSDWAKFTMILLYMRTVDGHIKMRLGRGFRTGFLRGAVTEPGDGPPAKAWAPEATDLSERVARRLDGYPTSLLTETLLGIPTTAHILGGAPMGDSPETGAIDHRHRLFGYEGVFVIDGAAISANPGVNPSLTIAALAERAMTFIPPKRELEPTA
ncbi:MAG: GMC family oxidoreductase [Geothrix sp.]|uniref:GMC oxidoreductase n=1 Tax=Geothrix sp. TaxID=1962974 RepID=UPI00180C2FAD|nr:GMC oxidoreductase [Geothrix sp.]NWJ41719.1 GMC family oxidoreductase [Geothrix sp.]WIL20301.1 MAG: GMC oxidoreductase [Geothrix sp.]